VTTEIDTWQLFCLEILAALAVIGAAVYIAWALYSIFTKE
jgi:hypothetical protein